MTKVEIYRLRDILHKMMYIKQADTDKTATHDKFKELHSEGMMICNRSIFSMQPLKIKSNQHNAANKKGALSQTLD